MNPLIMRWKIEPLKVSGFPDYLLFPADPVQSWRKFSAVFGTISLKSSMTTLPALLPSMVMSKKTFGFEDEV